MNRERRPALLAGIGLLLVVGVLVGGALAAPEWATRGSGERPTLVGSQSTGGGWHESGSVVRLDGGEVTWRSDTAASYFDVTQLADGRVLTAYEGYANSTDCGPFAAPCARTGYRILDPSGDGAPTIEEEWSFPVRTRGSSEAHDVEPLGDGYILADMEYERIVHVVDGEIVWQWNASSFYEAPADPTRRDWLHTNDVDVINDTHYLVSIRNAHQLVVVERNEGVQTVINADEPGSSDASCLKRGRLVDANGDGDVRCGDHSVINEQHNPQWLGEGAVLVADSGNNRVVELHRNETTGAWEPAWTVTSAQGVGLHWPRDADRLPNGNTLITDTFNSRVLEVNAEGETVWSVRLFHLPYEADRLPYNEPVGGQRYTSDGEISDPDGDVPGLTLLLFAVRGQFSFVPTWFGELHLGGVLLGLVFVLAGGVDELVRWRLD